MAVIVTEDGTGLSNSNSYLSEADLSTYATDRGVTLAGTPAVLLIQAMDYIEQMDFQGYKYTDAQALQWPRSYVVIDGYDIDVDTIPQLLADAVAEVCIGIDAGNNPLSAVPRETLIEKVGDLEIEYTKGARSQTYLKAAANKLSKLLSNNGLLRVVRV